jgi:hypothetical protein
MNDNVRAAVWRRVSTTEQHAENQAAEIERFVAHHGYDVTRTYALEDSAWNGGKENGEYRATLKRVLDDAWRGGFKVLVVWSLDRLTRGGAEDALRLLRKFRDAASRSCPCRSPGSTAHPRSKTSSSRSPDGWHSKSHAVGPSGSRLASHAAARRARPWDDPRARANRKPRKRSGYILREERKRAPRSSSPP